jgi:putative transcriptional regulator
MGAMKPRLLLTLLALAASIVASAPAWSSDTAKTMILVAKRSLQDRVYGSTVLIVRPLGERHVGFIVNKPTSLTLGKLFPKHQPSQKIADPVYLGGPTGSEVIFALVKGENPGARSLTVAPGLYLAYDSRVVDDVIEKQPQQARFFAGMVMWQPYELEEELKRGLWFVLDSQPEALLRKPSEGLWEELVGRAERRANTI